MNWFIQFTRGSCSSVAAVCEKNASVRSKLMHHIHEKKLFCFSTGGDIRRLNLAIQDQLIPSENLFENESNVMSKPKNFNNTVKLYE